MSDYAEPLSHSPGMSSISPISNGGSLHHVTAIASDPAANIHFYSQILGLRLVKKTVNFDDPGSYHLYYGDYTGSPGSLMTFFIWPGMRPISQHQPVISSVGFLIPAGSQSWWRQHFNGHGISLADRPATLNRLDFYDPDGLRLFLMEDQSASGNRTPHVPGAGILRLCGLEWSSYRTDRTISILTEVFGYQKEVSSEQAAWRSGDHRSVITVRPREGPPRTRFAPGQIHHAAFRVADGRRQAEMAEILRARGMQVTPVRPRKYFDSVYFLEPGGGICEIATDGPGMSVDEPVQSLGTRLCLPAELESQRAEITADLPPLEY